MPSRANAVIALVMRSWPLLVKYGPRVLPALTVTMKFVTDNTAVPAWFRERVQNLPTRLTDNEKQNGDAAKIRGTLDIIRDVARDAQRAGERIDAATYVARADRLERGVRLAETQDRPTQRAQLGKLKTDTEALLAEVLEAVSGTQMTATSTGGSETRPPAPPRPPADGKVHEYPEE